MFNEDHVQQVKELKLGIGDAITRYEEILSRLEAIYSVKPEKYEKQMEDMDKIFGLISKRRHTVRRQCLEATKVIENERNKKKAKEQSINWYHREQGNRGTRGEDV